MQPLYDLGSCAFKAGKLGAAAEYFERSLECIDTVSNAREAVRKTLAMLHAAHPTEAAVVLAYARVVAKVDGAEGVEEVCAAAGAAADMMERAGAPPAAAADARALCAAGAARARRVARVPDGLLLGGQCDTGAETVVATFASLADEGARDAVATAFVRRMGGACRGNGAYFKAVHVLQVALPYNPHLHAEWARLLRQQLEQEETAAKHMDFAVGVLEHTLAAARASDDAAAAKEAERELRRVKRERASWEGVPAGPRSVTQLVDERLKLEL
jgi:hypothetical protein